MGQRIALHQHGLIAASDKSGRVSAFTCSEGFGMLLGGKIAGSYDRLRQEGFFWFVTRSVKALKETLSPPWLCIYWFPVAEMHDLRGPNPNQVGGDKLLGLISRLLKSVELRVITSLSELKPQQYQALKDSVGGSDIPVYEQRLSQGIELHVLFVDQKVAGTLSFVFGQSHRFQHVVLTDRDAMALDGRVDPKFRGRGLYPIFLSLSLEKLKQRGVERLYIDTNENNEEANRSFVSVGFRFLIKYKQKRGRYRYDKTPI